VVVVITVQKHGVRNSHLEALELGAQLGGSFKRVFGFSWLFVMGSHWNERIAPLSVLSLFSAQACQVVNLMPRTCQGSSHGAGQRGDGVGVSASKSASIAGLSRLLLPVLN